MAPINTGRVLMGGLAAGLVLNVIDFAINNYVMVDDWARVAQMRNVDSADMTGTSAIMVFVIADFVLGLLLAVTYASIRPRFGPGKSTAVLAGCLIFAAIAAVMATFGGWLFPWDLYMKASALSFVALQAGALTAGGLYQES